MNVYQIITERGVVVTDLDRSVLRTPRPPRSDRPLAVVLLCTAGEAWVEFNMEILHIEPQTRLCFNNLMLSNYIRTSDDFAAIAILFDPAFAQDAAIGIATEQIIHLFEVPVARVGDDGDWQLLLAQTATLRQCGDMEQLPNAREVTLTLTHALLITMSGIMARDNNLEPRNVAYTQTDAYFRRFISEVSSNVTTKHEVAFYADRMNLTAKYLSDICKRKSGRTAKEIISTLLASRIKRELVTTTKSMKELAADFGFADQSSLGKFFRKVVGKSPLYFKQDHGGIINNYNDYQPSTND